MKKTVLLSYLIVGCLIASFAQDEKSDAKEKKINHYASIQVNQLLKQLFSLSNSANVQSPYFINYALNSVNSGYGMNAGFGYYFFETQEGDAFNSTETSDENFSFRIGAEQKFDIGKRWMASGGIDFISSKEKNSTISVVKNSFGETFTVQNDIETNATGGGIRGNISFLITDRILVGTEASYYYTKNKINNLTIEDFNGQVTETEDNPETKSITFNFPVVIWFTVKF